MPSDDYVKREDIFPAVTEIEKEIVFGGQDDDKVVDIINSIPAADVEPVRHGRWIPGNAVYCEYNEGHLVARYYDRWTCSVCNYVINDQHYSQILYKRCPECGAKMDKEEDHA